MLFFSDETMSMSWTSVIPPQPIINGDRNIWKYILLSLILLVCIIGIVILLLISWRNARPQNKMPRNNSMNNFLQMQSFSNELFDEDSV
jgi:uncharacterized protein YpmS